MQLIGGHPNGNLLKEVMLSRLMCQKGSVVVSFDVPVVLIEPGFDLMKINYDAIAMILQDFSFVNCVWNRLGEFEHLLESPASTGLNVG